MTRPQPGVVGRERGRDERSILLTRHIVQVLHRGLDIRMPHPLLYTPDIGLADHPSAERVPQIVEAQRS